MKILRNRIKEYRDRLGLTQQELAGQAGVSSRTIISLETGQYNPSLMLAYRLSVIFDTTVEELYCLKENKAQEDAEHESKKK